MHERSTQTGPGCDFLSFVNREQLGVFATAIFERVGYFTTPGEGLAVHGIDFIVYKPDGSEPEIALRCRPDGDEKVEVQDVVRFWEKITSQGYERGIFVTNKTFSESAFTFAGKRDLILVDQDGLKKGINALPAAHQTAVLKQVAAAQESRPLMKDVAVPNLELPGRETAGSIPDKKAMPSDSDAESGRKIFRTPSAARDREQDELPSIEEEETPVLETPVFGSPAPSPTINTEAADDDDLQSWCEDEEEAWDGLEDSNRKVKSATNLLAILSPVMLGIAGLLLWEPLMGSGDPKGQAIVAPVVSEYLQAKASGKEFDVVAEVTSSLDAEKNAN